MFCATYYHIKQDPKTSVNSRTLMAIIELCMGEIKGKLYFKFHKVHFRANSALLPTELATKSALLHHKECMFYCNKALFAIQ